MLFALTARLEAAPFQSNGADRVQNCGGESSFSAAFFPRPL